MPGGFFTTKFQEPRSAVPREPMADLDSVKKVEQLADGVAVLERMPESGTTVDAVAVPSSLLLHLQDSLDGQLRKDPLHSPLRDAHLIGKIADPHRGFAGQDDENMSVVGEKGPTRLAFGIGITAGWQGFTFHEI